MAKPDPTPAGGKLNLTPRQIELLMWQMIVDMAGGAISTIPPDDKPERRVMFFQDCEYVEMTCEGMDDE